MDDPGRLEQPQQTREMMGAIRLFHLLIAAVLIIGCSRTSPTSKPAGEARTDRTGQPQKSDLAAELAALTAPQQRTLKRLLADSPSVAERQIGEDESVARIARALRRLTLTEADELGVRLDSQHGGAASEFALFPIRQQQLALDRIRQIHGRLTKERASPDSEDHWIAEPVTTVERDLKWLQRRVGRNVVEVTGLSFIREHYDLGPGETDVSDDEMRIVAVFTGLERLGLRMSQVGDQGLAHLSGLRGLKHLDLDDTRVTDEGLRHLAGMSQLSELRLQRTNVNGPGLKHLSECTRLARLTFEVRPSRAFDLGSLNDLKSLEELSVDRVWELDLHDLSKLAKVTFSMGGAVDKPGILRLANLPALEVVGAGVHDARLTRFEIQNLPKIRSLWIETDNPIVSFNQIGALANLRELVIRGGNNEKRISDADVRHLVKLRHLALLNLGGKLEAGSLRHIGSLTSLQKLTFDGEPLDDAELSHLGKLKNLQELTLEKFHGSGRGFDVIRHLPSLRSLTLFLVDLDSLRIVDHPSLQRIHGDACRIGDLHVTGLPKLQWFGVSQLKTETVTIGDLPATHWLSLSLIRADEIRRVSLHAMPRLSTLQLVPTTPEGSIENLQFTANLGDEVLSDIATFPNLETLYITHSAMTDAGLKQLAPLRKLRSIGISGPHVSQEALRQLREAH